MKKPTILIVEDETLIAEQIRSYLNNFGYMNVHLSRSGEKAIQIAEDIRPILILMDIRLDGEMDGIEAVKRIRQTYHPVVIFITAFSEDSILERAKKVQPSGYLTKPIRKSDLKANLETALYVAEVESRRRSAEKELRQRERWLNSTFHQAAVGIANLDLNGLLIRVNARCCDILGYSREELVGMDILTLAHTDDQEIAREKRGKIIRGEKESETCEIRIIRKQGESVWVSFNLSMVVDETNQAEFFLCVVKDINDRKVAEQALRESIEENQTLIDHIPQRVFYKNKDLEYVTVNKTFAQDFGLDRQSFYKKTDFDLFSKELATTYREADLNVLETGEVMEFQATYSLKGVDLIIISTRIPKKNEQGEVEGIIGVFWDITDQLAMEAEKKDLKRLLQQTQKMEAIGTLAGGIAHDFNNILHPIIGFSTLGVRSTNEHPKQQSYFQNIRDAATRAKKLVQQILTFSRQNESELRPILVQPIIKEALKMLRSSLPTTIELISTVEEDCPPIKADATQIHQIIMNLATNAYHAMQDSGGKLSVDLEPITVESDNTPIYNMRTGNYLRLSVKDTGSGIPQHLLAKIFDPYFTTKPVEKGTGLGLSVVMGIVQNHEGYLTVNSVPEKGTEFLLFFPATVDVQAIETRSAGLPRIHGIENIMVVDDEEGIVHFQKEALKALGYTVFGFTSSEQALEEFVSDPGRYDVVITDMTMPGLTGYNLAKEMLKIRSDLPIILCTGYTDTVDEDMAKTAGIRQFLIKPIDQDDLAAAIRTELAS